MHSKTMDKKSAAPAVTNEFQDLKYLKAIPKRVDCWLGAKTKKQTVQTPSSKDQKNVGGSMSNLKFSQTFKGSSNKAQMPSPYTNRNDKESKGVGLRKSLETLPEMHYARVSNQGHNIDAQLSYDSYEIYPHDELPSVSQKQAAHVSMVSQDDEKLESLLERLEESRLNEKGFTAQERNMIMEDTQNLAILSGSDTLLNIFQLMYNAEERMKNEEGKTFSHGAAQTPNDKAAIKKNFDFEFEKLLLMLKEQYHGLFKEYVNFF